MNTMIPTISYLEVRNTNTRELLDTLYIGPCDYEIKQFNLSHFKDSPKQAAAHWLDVSDNPNYKTMAAFIKIEDYHITKLKHTVADFYPQTMEDDNALYDMKLFLYWVNEKCEEHANTKIEFAFITYYAILENIEYDGLINTQM